MRTLRGTEVQCFCEFLDGRPGGQRLTALFEPDVPVDRNARELRNFFASQARGASPAARSDSEVSRIRGFAPLPQKLAELLVNARGSFGVGGLHYPRIMPSVPGRIPGV